MYQISMAINSSVCVSILNQ